MEYFTELGYFGMFVAAYLAATMLPLSSEIVLTTLLLGGASPYALVAVATVGNVLGAVTNYALGYWASLEIVRRWIKTSEEEFVKAEQRFVKCGLFSLLFAWVPFIGDPITVAAGVLRIRFFWFVVLVTTGKLARYIVVSSLVLQAY